MKRAILWGCVSCSALFAGSSTLRASVQSFGEGQAPAFSGLTADILICPTSSGFADRSIRCIFSRCVRVTNPPYMIDLKNTVESIDRQCLFNPETLSLGYDDGNSIGRLPELAQDNGFAEADRSSACELILVLSDFDLSGEGLQRELPPDDIAIDKSYRHILRSGRTEQPAKSTWRQEHEEKTPKLVLELQAMGLSGCDLTLICNAGRVFFDIASGVRATADLFKAGATGFLWPKRTLHLSDAGMNQFSIPPNSSTETDPGVWLKRKVPYRRTVAARLKCLRIEAYWESYYYNYEHRADWIPKSLLVVPEPSTLALVLLSCLTLIHAYRRSR